MAGPAPTVSSCPVQSRPTGRRRDGTHLDEDLHASSQTQHEVQRALLLNVVVAERASILQLLACEDQALLVGWDAFLVLNLRLDIVNSVARLDFKGDGLSGERLRNGTDGAD